MVSICAVDFLQAHKGEGGGGPPVWRQGELCDGGLQEEAGGGQEVAGRGSYPGGAGEAG